MNFTINETFQSTNNDFGLTQNNFTIKIIDRQRTFERSYARYLLHVHRDNRVF
jgi:hypothetical protein